MFRKVTPETARTFVLSVAIVLFGELLNAITFRTFIMPIKLLSSGVIGISLLLNQLFNLPVGLQTTIYNIPIFLLGYRYLGRRFLILSLIGVASFSVLVDNVRVPALDASDKLLFALFAGVLTGTADGLIMRTGGSTGGTDIIGLIVSRRFGISLGQVLLVFNAALLVFGAIVRQDPTVVMYTLIMLYVASRAIDAVQATTPRRVALVISDHDADIAARLMSDLRRGATYLEASGAYTNIERRVLMCVVTRYELVELREIVRKIDPEAFTIVLDAIDVIGYFEKIPIWRRLLKN
ncbi:MAG TPA: YitT family protein [Aggregatilineales bacterium]|nr:YitT family protein [Aggregatilineales bacterium]